MSSRQGGKAKPLKQPKKLKKEETEEERIFKEKQASEEKALKEMKEIALQRGGIKATGIKKSGKK